MLKKTSNKKIIVCIMYIIYCVGVFWPIMKMGIACNDDLRWRLYASEGLGMLGHRYIEASASQGRILSSVQVISLWLACFPNRVLYGMIKILFFGINIVLIGKLLQILCNEKMARLYVMIMPLLLQVTLQHTPPDAFSMFIVLPACYFLVALLLFNQYLLSERRLLLVFSLILYFMSICSYEVFILYSPLFLVVVLKRIDKERSILRKMLKIKWHVIVGGLYLLLYVGQRYVFPSNYAGNKISITSIEETVSLLTMLIKSGIPGIYALTGKGQYLFNYILGFPTSLMNTVLNRVLDFRITILFIFVAMVLIYILQPKEKKNVKMHIGAFLLAIVYMVCPPILNAISPSWVAMGDVNDIIGLPMSYLISLSAVVAVCAVISYVSNISKGLLKSVICGVSVIIVLVWGGVVQIYNMVYAEYQISSIERIEHMENVLDTTIVQSLECRNIYSVDMCKPYVMQCADIGYWNNYVQYNDLNIGITDQPTEKFNYIKLDNSNDISFLGVDAFVVEDKVYAKEVYVISNALLNGKKIIYETQAGLYGNTVCQAVMKDNDCWVEQIVLDEPICISNISVD